MAAHADPKTLWLVNSLIVSVDDAPTTKVIFPVGQTIRLSFQHEGQRVHGTVTREQLLYGGRVEYSLAIEGKPVDKGMIQTGILRHLLIVLVGPFTLAGALLAFLLRVPWYVVIVCVVGSVLWSLATIRLVARDHAIKLPARKHNGG